MSTTCKENYASAECVHSYTTKEFAFANGLAYVQDDGKVVMKGDDFTTLPAGVNRNRYVRVYGARWHI